MNTPIKGRIICYRTERNEAGSRMFMDISEYSSGRVESIECHYGDAYEFPVGEFVKVHPKGLAKPSITSFNPPAGH